MGYARRRTIYSRFRCQSSRYGRRRPLTSLVLNSQTLTSPSNPPVMMNRWLCDSAKLVTPPRCALSIVQSGDPLSTSWALILPSSQPETTMSRVMSEGGVSN